MSEPILEAKDVWFRYGGEPPVLTGIDLAVYPGQFVGLVGSNGSGKTTLLKQFNGLLRPQGGCVRVAGQDTASLSIGELSRQTAYLFQQPEQQIFAATVEQELAFGPRNQGLAAGEVERRVQAALERFGLTAVAQQPPSVLSYGLRRRITLASLATVDAPVLMLDEPTVGLDLRGRAETVSWLRELHSAGRTILLVTHDMSLVAEEAERAVVLHRGRVEADGTPAELFQREDLLAAASLEPPPVVALGRALGLHEPGPIPLTPEAFCDALAARRADHEPAL